MYVMCIVHSICTVRSTCLQYTLFVTAYSRDLCYESVNIILSCMYLVVCVVCIITNSLQSNDNQLYPKFMASVLQRMHVKVMPQWGRVFSKSFWGSTCYSSHSAIHFWRWATCREKKLSDCQVGNNAQLGKNWARLYTSCGQHVWLLLSRFQWFVSILIVLCPDYFSPSQGNCLYHFGSNILKLLWRHVNWIVNSKMT